jgi:glycosyltransferase
MPMVVTFVIASYNVESSIHISLSSIEKQTFKDWECIVVDALSQDKTLEVVRTFQDRDARYRYISESDNGVYDAYNKGWKLAKGEWVIYLGADDEILPDSLSAVFASDHSSSVIYGNIILKTYRGLLYRKPSPYPDSLRKNMCFFHQSVIMRKRVLQEMEGFSLSYKISSDYDLLLRSYLSGKSFEYVDIYIATFNSVGGLSSSCIFNWESYYIRKRNKSTSILFNLAVFYKGVCIKIMRSISHKMSYLFKTV